MTCVKSKLSKVSALPTYECLAKSVKVFYRFNAVTLRFSSGWGAIVVKQFCCKK